MRCHRIGRPHRSACREHHVAVTDDEDHEPDGSDDDWDDDDPFTGVWTTTDPLGMSRAQEALEEDSDADDAAAAALRRERDSLARELQEARLRHAAEPNAELRSLLTETAEAADPVTELAVIAGQLYVQLEAARRGWIDYAETAAADVTQNAQTTLSAIALLLRHGYALDAEARWRGLHELACTAALLAVDDKPAEICKRYLAHGQRLLVDDPAYSEPWVRNPHFFSWNYEWLRQSHPNVDKKEKPIRFSQRWLFDNADMTSAPFDKWLRPSHGPVHLSSRAVAEGSEQAGAAPAGYSRERTNQVAWQVGCSFYELVAYVLRLPDEDGLPLERRLAWVAAVRELVEALRPGPVMDRFLTPAEELGLL